VLPHFGTESLSTRCAEEPTTLPRRELGFGEASVEEEVVALVWTVRYVEVLGGRRSMANRDVASAPDGKWVVDRIKGAERRRR
jgi:hypothetical protein